MKKILFPTDFSDIAGNAFVYALHLAQSLQAEVYVLHAYLLPVLSERFIYPDLMKDVYESLELEEFENYHQQVPQLHKIAEAHGLDHLPISFIFEQGTVVTAVEKNLAANEISMIVMGTAGASGRADKHMGSNTVQVIEEVDIPVLCIPQEARFIGVQYIAFTTIFREVDKQALTHILPIAGQLKAQVQCVHVLTGGSYQEVDDTIAQWADEFDSDRLHFVVIRNNDVEKAIVGFLREEHTDVLVMVKRNRDFFTSLFQSSLSNKFAYHDRVPVMVLHE